MHHSVTNMCIGVHIYETKWCIVGWLSHALLDDCPIHCEIFNTLRPRQNGRRFTDDTFKRIFVNENVRILIKISLKFVPKGPINNNPALVQIMAWRRSGDKPLSEPMMVSLLTHICVTRPQWVKMGIIDTSPNEGRYMHWLVAYYLNTIHFISSLHSYLLVHDWYCDSSLSRFCR